MTPYWADLHNHNDVGYGKGTLERSYLLAENSLDIYAFTPHGYWPDPPASDPKMAQYHVEQFDRISALFPRVVETANARYRPGRFVTFIAYEWHSEGWGDYVVLFPGDSGDLFRARDLDELKSFARKAGALLIPHHVAYKHPWRGLDWAGLDPDLSPVAEVFSEHGNSLERDALHPMLLHSMGGATRSQTVLEQLRRGRHIGFTAGTDDHFGYPACYGEGLTAVAATALTREAVFAALKARRTCAVTGDRIELELQCGPAGPGDLLPAAAPRRFDIAIRPLGPIDYVQLLRNGETAALWPGPAPTPDPGPGRFLLPVDWGWGRMGHAELTDWDIDIAVEGGEIARILPCFCGGPDVDRVNLVTAESPTRARIRSFTSRRNSRPINGIQLLIDAAASARLRLTAAARAEDDSGECRLDAPLDDLLRDDLWAKPLRRFSSPRLRLGQAHRADALALHTRWQDPAQGRASYILKVQQKNGHCAWTSPLLFA
jgi:hypothetical protein